MLPTIRNGASGLMKNFDNMFSRIFDDFPVDMFDTQFFRGDIYTGNDNEMYVDVPGFNRENIEVDYQDEILTITGENDFGRKIRKQIRLGATGPPIEAEVKDGVLKLVFEQSQKEPTKIDVR